jgi:hypothetical protein
MLRSVATKFEPESESPPLQLSGPVSNVIRRPPARDPEFAIEFEPATDMIYDYEEVIRFLFLAVIITG